MQPVPTQKLNAIAGFRRFAARTAAGWPIVPVGRLLQPIPRKPRPVKVNVTVITTKESSE